MLFSISVILKFPFKFSLQGTFKPFPSPVFTAFPLTSNEQMFNPSKRKKQTLCIFYLCFWVNAHRTTFFCHSTTYMLSLS